MADKAADRAAATPRRVLLIYNPAAGWGRRRRLTAVLRALERHGVAPTLRATARRGDAEAFARQARVADFDCLAVAGGDGTINEALNGLADPLLPLAIVPLGTANVLAAEIGLARHPAVTAQTIACGEPVAAALGMVNGRRFVVVAGIGFDARTVARVHGGLKRWAGKLAYIAAGLVEFARYRPARYAVTVDGRNFVAASVIIANGRYYAGRFVFAPQASLGSPHLDVCLLTRPGRWNLLRYALATLSGRIERLRDVVIVQGTTITVDGPPGDPIEADGDIVGGLPAHVTVQPDAVRLVRPPA